MLINIYKVEITLNYSITFFRYILLKSMFILISLKKLLDYVIAFIRLMIGNETFSNSINELFKSSYE